MRNICTVGTHAAGKRYVLLQCNSMNSSCSLILAASTASCNQHLLRIHAQVECDASTDFFMALTEMSSEYEKSRFSLQSLLNCASGWEWRLVSST